VRADRASTEKRIVRALIMDLARVEFDIILILIIFALLVALFGHMVPGSTLNQPRNNVPI
jgi:H+/gluconate symporter-like permease